MNNDRINRIAFPGALLPNKFLQTLAQKRSNRFDFPKYKEVSFYLVARKSSHKSEIGSYR